MSCKRRIGSLLRGSGVALCLIGGGNTSAAGPFDYIPAADQAQHSQSGFQKQQLLIGSSPALDPVSGQPIEFVHVDLGAAAGGDGSFEHPFNSLSSALAAAKQADIVYVRAGSSGTVSSFTVPVGILVLSSGPPQVIATKNQPSLTLPLSGSGVLPKVAGTVTVSSNTTLSGFDITTGTGAGVDGENVIGSVDISGNVIHSAGAGNSGIQILNSAGASTLRVAGNTVSGGKSSGIQVKSDGTAQITAAVTGNIVTNNVGSGIFFFVSRGRVDATISNNSTTQNQATIPQESGIRFGVFSDAQGTVTLSGNMSQGNIGNGIFVGAEGVGLVNATITGNTTNGNTGHGTFLGATENGTAIGIITGNTSNNNVVNTAFAPFPTGSGIFVGSQLNGRTTALVQSNIARGNGDLGIFCFVANNAAETAYVLNNTSAENTRTGIEVNVGLNGAPGNPAAPGDMPEATAIVSGNTVSDNQGIGPPLGGGGLFVLSFNRALVRTVIENNTIQGNAKGTGAFGGMGLVAVQSAEILATVRGNSFAGNGGANPSFTALTGVPPAVLGGVLTGPGHICLRLTNNNSDSGYALVRPGGTTLQAETTNNVGMVVVPAAPVDPLTDCPVPG